MTTDLVEPAWFAAKHWHLSRLREPFVLLREGTPGGGRFA